MYLVNSSIEIPGKTRRFMTENDIHVENNSRNILPPSILKKTWNIILTALRLLWSFTGTKFALIQRKLFYVIYFNLQGEYPTCTTKVFINFNFVFTHVYTGKPVQRD